MCAASTRTSRPRGRGGTDHRAGPPPAARRPRAAVRLRCGPRCGRLAARAGRVPRGAARAAASRALLLRRPADPATWPTPTAERTVEDAQYGTVRVRAWAGLHPKLQDRTGHGTKRPSPIVPMTLVLVEVGRLPGRPYPPQALWLWLQAPAGYPLDRDLLWRASVRRSGAPWALEHTFRFIRQTLGRHTPRVRHPAQADRRAWLVLAAYTQLCRSRGGWPLSRRGSRPPVAPRLQGIT